MQRCLSCLILVLLFSLIPVHAQTLAHPGWRGNGIAPEAWWKHAAIARFGEDATFEKIERQLNDVSAAGADSVLLPDLQPASNAAQPYDPRFGSGDQLDALLREASARRMHVLLRVPLLRIAGSGGELRFWMSRGIAGFAVGDVHAAEMDTLHLLRTMMDRFPGQRVVVARVADAGGSPQRTRGAESRGGPVLQMVTLEEAESSRGPSAIEIKDASALPRLGSAVPIFEASLLETDTGREAVRQMLVQRSRRGSRDRRRP